MAKNHVLKVIEKTWDSITVKRGRLSGGMLTDKMIRTIYPATSISLGKGLLSVSTWEDGRKPIIKIR